MENSAYLGLIIKQMVLCSQDPIFHAEGDVWKHIKMCLEYLVNFNLYKELNDEEKIILFLGVLFHDVGKPITTKDEDIGITSKGHSVKGARLIRELIIKWNADKLTNIPFNIREAVCNLTLLHMLPVYLLEKKDPLYSVAASSAVISNKLLEILAICDINGRICTSEGVDLATERITLFSMFCKEYDCWDKPYKFVSENSRFRYFFEHKGHPDYDYFEPVHGKVTIMCGLQASGKDYIIKEKYSNLPSISLDQTRLDMDLDFGDDEPAILREAKERCKNLMREKEDFIFNATNLHKDIRIRWINLFRSYRYNITIYYKERPLNVILEANSKREHKVPESVILEKVTKIDIPTLMECHNLILDVN